MTKSKDIIKKRICQVDGCERKHMAFGYCENHYRQIKKHGKILSNPKKLKRGEPNRCRFEDGICKIELYDKNGNVKAETIIDAKDYKKIKDIKWHLSNGYVMGAENIKLYRVIMDLPLGDEKEIDHKDGNPLNNRRNNLRVCYRSENMQNSQKYKNNTSGYKGVHWSKRTCKWVARIGFNQKKHFLGRFDCPVKAALKYDEVAKKWHGEFARLNFPSEKIKEIGL